MADDMQARDGVSALLRQARPHHPGPATIADIRDFQRRRMQGVEARSTARRSRRADDAAVLRQKRALADQLFELCARASEAVRTRGSGTADDLERIAELSLVVSYLDAETEPEAELTRAASRLEESRDFLAAMALASDITRLLARDD